MVVTLNAKLHGNLYNNTPNQLKRAIGKFTKVYCGGGFDGTVQDAAGVCWDWWLTEEVLPGGFPKVRIVKAV